MTPFFIIGAQKSGTTYLHDLLTQTNKFSTPATKEPHYFTKKRPLTLTSYLEIFKKAEGKNFILDASTTYFASKDTAAKIKSLFPDTTTTILMVVREPTSRIRSAYLHSLKHGRELRKFQDIINIESSSYKDIYEEETEKAKYALSKGKLFLKPSDSEYIDPFFNFRYISNTLYADLLTPYLQNFNQTFVIDFADLISKPVQVTSASLRAINESLNTKDVNTQNNNQNSTTLSYRTSLKRLSENIVTEQAKQSKNALLPITKALSYLTLIQRVHQAKKNSLDIQESLPWCESARQQHEAVLKKHNLLALSN